MKTNRRSAGRLPVQAYQRLASQPPVLPLTAKLVSLPASGRSTASRTWWLEYADGHLSDTRHEASGRDRFYKHQMERIVFQPEECRK